MYFGLFSLKILPRLNYYLIKISGRLNSVTTVCDRSQGPKMVAKRKKGVPSYRPRFANTRSMTFRNTLISVLWSLRMYYAMIPKTGIGDCKRLLLNYRFIERTCVI